MDEWMEERRVWVLEECDLKDNMRTSKWDLTRHFDNLNQTFFINYNFLKNVAVNTILKNGTTASWPTSGMLNTKITRLCGAVESGQTSVGYSTTNLVTVNDTGSFLVQVISGPFPYSLSPFHFLSLSRLIKGRKPPKMHTHTKMNYEYLSEDGLDGTD